MTHITIPADFPCIESKCLKLPICKSKKQIRCNELRRYTDNINHILKTRDDLNDHIIKSSFQVVLSMFPNIESVFHEKPDIRVMDYSIRSEMNLQGIK